MKHVDETSIHHVHTDWIQRLAVSVSVCLYCFTYLGCSSYCVHPLHIKYLPFQLCNHQYALIGFFSELLFWFIGLAVPVPQAIADPEPADLDRVQCGVVPVILSAALWALEPHFVSGPYSLLQLLCPFQTAPRPHCARQSLLLPSVLQQLGAQVAVKVPHSETSPMNSGRGGEMGGGPVKTRGLI